MISIIGMHIENEVPKKINFYPQIVKGKLGFEIQVTNLASKIDYLEYLWVAVLDDRLLLRCETVKET